MVNISDKMLDHYLNKLEWKYYSSKNEFVCTDKNHLYLGVYKISHENDNCINCKLGVATSDENIGHASYSFEVVAGSMDDAFDIIERKRRSIVKMILLDILEEKKKKENITA